MNLTVYRAWAVILVLIVGGLGYLVYTSQMNPDGRHFKFGLDLVGGTHLVYEADTSQIDPTQVSEAMAALRDVIERRVNLFGVSEPIVQVEKASFVSGAQHPDRLIVELPGVTDIQKAIALIGATPVLEFKLVGPNEATTTTITSATGSTTVATTTVPTYIDTGLTGRYLTRARLEFQGGTSAGGLAGEPIVLVDFNSVGKDLFAQITSDNVGKELAIFLDGRLISHPVIKEPITGGTAVISGGFTPTEARDLVRNLNIGALPVPITLASSQTIGATLGAEILSKGIRASIIGFIAVLVFMLLWYRLPGLVAGLALTMYVVIMLALFKYLPVTISASGIAGFLLSIGMAVDANVLIFERMKEELRNGLPYVDAVREGFARAWPPIRDGNATSLISAVVLFWLGTSVVQGFALVFGIGILASMFTAITVTRTILIALAGLADKVPTLLKSGLTNK